MTRVIHTGDTHLGYRQYHSPTRRQDFLDAFRQVVQDAIADDVDAVVHAGDLYHDRRPGLRDLLGTIDVLEPLRDNDIPFLAVVGNHEGTRDAQWLDLFETLGLAERLDDAGRRVGNTVFYGLDYVPESRRGALDYRFADPAVDHPGADHTALVSHGLFTPFAHANWDLEAVLRESTVAFDAVLLGDNHTPDTVQLDDTWVTYCGSTERASADERDPRGYNIVEFTAEVTITRRGLDTRDFVFVDAELGPGDGPEFVLERLREHDLEGAVVIVTIQGDGETITPAEIEAVGREQDALVTRVNDRREIESPDGDLEVSFADPDEAVRERVREMGLSEAARAVDETVRDDTVVDTNVRERVRSHVTDALDDPGAFESTDPAPAPRDADDGDGGRVDADTAAQSASGATGNNPAASGAEPQPAVDPADDAGESQPVDGGEAADAAGAGSGGETVEAEAPAAPGEAVEAGVGDSPVETGEATEAHDDGVEDDDPSKERGHASADDDADEDDGENATMEDFL